jgi:hypothetical protein
MIWLKPAAESTNMAGSGMVVATYRQGNDGTWSFWSSGACEQQRALDDGLDPATWALPGHNRGLRPRPSRSWSLSRFVRAASRQRVDWPIRSSSTATTPS